MPLTGHLSDLSLSELIEFFCNQRKTGCLDVLYPQGHGSFFLQSGSVIDAKIGVLRGIDAVYYALTLPNAAFEFKGSSEAQEKTINQPWTQVVLEGLRRLDEGITPNDAFPEGSQVNETDEVVVAEKSRASEFVSAVAEVPSFLFGAGLIASRRKPLVAGAVAVAVLASVAVIGVPAGWYRRIKAVVPAQEAKGPAQPVAQPVPAGPSSSTPAPTTRAADAALAAKRLRDKERARALAAAAAQTASTNPNERPSGPTDSKPGPRKVSVQVSYDESGRVIQASGGDPTAVRIARQKHFPSGKAGTATVTIEMN